MITIASIIFSLRNERWRSVSIKVVWAEKEKQKHGKFIFLVIQALHVTMCNSTQSMHVFLFTAHIVLPFWPFI